MDLKYQAPLGKSDQSILSFSFSCYFNNKLSSKKYLYDKANFEDMKRSLEEKNWLEKVIENVKLLDVEMARLKLKCKLYTLQDKNVPRNKVGEIPWKAKGDIPISKDLHQLKKDKKGFHRKWFKAIKKVSETRLRE